MGKPKEEKPFSLQEVKDKVNNDIKQKQQIEKETNTMNKKQIIGATIALTLTTLVILATAFYFGTKFGVSYEQSVNNRVLNEAKSLVTITAEAKK